jgi:hypothetical protein
MFSLSLFSFFYALGGFDDIWGEESLLQKFLFNWNGMVITVDILAVDVNSGMELCMPI